MLAIPLPLLAAVVAPDLVRLIVVLFVLGVGLYLFNAKVTAIDPTIKQVINAVVGLFLVLYLLRAFGVI